MNIIPDIDVEPNSNVAPYASNWVYGRFYYKECIADINLALTSEHNADVASYVTRTLETDHFTAYLCQYLSKAVFEAISTPPNSRFDWHNSITDPFSVSAAVVFHGTPKTYVDQIIGFGGLDPQLRDRQAYGPGEYFGATPQRSLKYCMGDNVMLVFLVLLPPGDRADSEFVVVNNTHHQLLLGRVTFESENDRERERKRKLVQASQRKRELVQASQRKSVDKRVRLALDETRNERVQRQSPKFEAIVQEREKEKRKELQELLETQREKDGLATNSQLTMTSLSKMLVGNTEPLEVIGEMYQKHSSLFSRHQLEELSFLLRPVDPDLVSFYFPGVPVPFILR